MKGEEVNRPVVAVATLGETREDVRKQRESLVQEERQAIGWLRDYCDPIESPVLSDPSQVRQFAESARKVDPHVLVIHLPVWTNPVLSVQLCSLLPIPTILLGNGRPETSSLVGILGAGGALDQAGIAHERVFDHNDKGERQRVGAFFRAAFAKKTLQGRTLGLFGGRSLGILTAAADASQIMRIFGVDIEPVDQAVIIERARGLPVWRGASAREMAYRAAWRGAFRRIVYHGGPGAAGEGLHRNGAACRGEGIRLCRSEVSARAERWICKPLRLSHADEWLRRRGWAERSCSPRVRGGRGRCSHHADPPYPVRGQPAGLLDVRWMDPRSGVLTLANCGAMPAAFAADGADPSGLSRVRMVPHSFGGGRRRGLAFRRSPRESDPGPAVQAQRDVLDGRRGRRSRAQGPGDAFADYRRVPAGICAR